MQRPRTPGRGARHPAPGSSNIRSMPTSQASRGGDGTEASPRPHLLHVFATFRLGGPQARTIELLNSVPDRFSHTIMAMDGSFDASAGFSERVSVTLRHPPRRRSSAVYPWLLAAVVKKIRPDLVITSNWGSMDALVGARMASVAPIIHTEDGFGPDEARSLKLRRVIARRVFLNTIHTTVVGSRNLEDIALRRYRVNPRKLRFIPNGVDVERIRPGRAADWRRELGLPESAVVFGFLGALRAEKNLELLLGAFRDAQLPTARLVVVGQGPMRAAWEAAARELGLGSQVVFAGFVEDRVRALAGIDVFVMSSTTEQAPLALLEAMAAGLPAVCTDVGDTREILGAPQQEFVLPLGDRAGYAARLRELASSPELRARLGGANRERAVAEYSLARMVRNYLDLFDGALARR